jgi:tRNA (cytidine/uridine-2'-O-)-methyltransferase
MIDTVGVSALSSDTARTRVLPDLVFFEPCIPGNTGNAIRLSAVVGCTLHLIRPLGFELDDKRLKRAGLDYHDLGHFEVHDSFEEYLAAADALAGREINVYAFSSHASEHFGEVQYQPCDALLFGPEPSGLPDNILQHPRITKSLRIPMQNGVRSLNLAVSASVAIYEAWRQMGYRGA